MVNILAWKEQLKANIKKGTKIRSGLMNKEAQLTTIALIKAEAMQIELIFEKWKKKSAIGINVTNRIFETPIFNNQIDSEVPDDIDFISSKTSKCSKI